MKPIEKNLLITQGFLLLTLVSFHFLGGFDEEELLIAGSLLLLHLPNLFWLRHLPAAYLRIYTGGIWLILALKCLFGLIGFTLMMIFLSVGMLFFAVFLLLKSSKILTEAKPRLTREQVTAVLAAIDDYQIDRAFELLDGYGVRSAKCSRLREIYIGGLKDVDFIKQLRLCVLEMQAED